MKTTNYQYSSAEVETIELLSTFSPGLHRRELCKVHHGQMRRTFIIFLSSAGGLLKAPEPSTKTSGCVRITNVTRKHVSPGSRLLQQLSYSRSPNLTHRVNLEKWLQRLPLLIYAKVLSSNASKSESLRQVELGGAWLHPANLSVFIFSVDQVRFPASFLLLLLCFSTETVKQEPPSSASTPGKQQRACSSTLQLTCYTSHSSGLGINRKRFCTKASFETLQAQRNDLKRFSED